MRLSTTDSTPLGDFGAPLPLNLGCATGKHARTVDDKTRDNKQ